MSTVSSLIVGCRDLDLQRVVALDRDLGTHLDDGVELDVAVFLARGDVDLGRRDHVDALGDDGFEVELGQRVAQRLIACDLGAEPGFEDAPRRLAGTEAVDLHLVRELAERRVDRPLEVGGRDRDVQTNLVVVERFRQRSGETWGYAAYSWTSRPPAPVATSLAAPVAAQDAHIVRVPFRPSGRRTRP